MKIKKMLFGMAIAGFMLGSADFSFAGRNQGHQDRGQCRVEKNYGKRDKGHWNKGHWNKGHRDGYHRNGYRGQSRHYQRYSRPAHPPASRGERRNSHDPKVRVLVTPLGIFPVIW